MDRWISAKSTLLLKGAVPAILFVAIGLSLWAPGFEAPVPVGARPRIGGMGLLLIPMILLVSFWPLCRVRLAGDALTVARWWRTTRVPLSSVASVSQLHGDRGIVTVELHAEVAPLGRQFKFLPRESQWTPFGEDDAIVRELRDLAGVRAPGA